MTEAPEDSATRFQRTQSREDFEAMAKEWLPSIRRFVYVHLGPDAQGCDEVQQEVLIALMRNVAGFSGASQFSTFLYRLVRNKAIDHIRREARYRRRNVSLDQGIDASAAVLATGEDPLETLAKGNTADRLWALIWRLPAQDRELVHLREVEGLGERECSQILGQPVGTLKSRLHRIKKKLYQRMVEEGGS